MESKELITEEITLTEEGLKNKQLEKRKKECEIYEISKQIIKREMLLEKDILNRQIKESLAKLRTDIERKENSKGEQLSDADIDYLTILIALNELDLKEDISNKTLRTQLSDLNGQLEFEKHNLSVIEKQIREKKVISVHR
jgi:hypothetical protein